MTSNACSLCLQNPFSIHGPLTKFICFSFQLDFEDCFTEHEKTKTFSALYQVLGIIYKYTKLVLYHIFVIIVGIPLTIVWAIVNSITTFYLVWMWGPALRLFMVLIYAVAPAVTIPFNALVSPVVDVFARIFRQCRIRVSGDFGNKAANHVYSV